MLIQRKTTAQTKELPHPLLAGPRVSLRQWTAADAPPFAAMNADPEVMRFFPKLLSMEESLSALLRQQNLVETRGWGLWVVEIDGEFAGFTGLAEPNFQASFMPCVEIGWRFHRRYWGRGYALEAARLALRFAFEELQLPEVVSFTTQLNERSQALMRRLGMAHSPSEDFEHPLIAEGDPLRPHVLYRLRNAPEVVQQLNIALHG